MILGTAAYMSPEQAKGKAVDRRADIWAFGCVLYKMLTGKRIFERETVSDVLAAVIRAEPDFAALPPNTPPQIRDLLRRSLNKDPKNRLRDIGEAGIAIAETLSGAGSAAEVSSPSLGGQRRPSQAWYRGLRWTVGVGLALAVGAASLFWLHTPATPPVARLVIDIPQTDRLAPGPLSHIALSPDGSRLVYVATRGGTSQLYVRPIDRFEATPIPGTEGAGRSPFFSPDGQSVGFFAEGKVKTVSLSGGAPFTVCVAGGNRGGGWAPDGTIIFSPSLLTGLFRVSAAGGTPNPLTTLDRQKGEFGHRYPQILPGGKAVLFTIMTSSSFDDAPTTSKRSSTSGSMEGRPLGL